VSRLVDDLLGARWAFPAVDDDVFVRQFGNGDEELLQFRPHVLGKIFDVLESSLVRRDEDHAIVALSLVCLVARLLGQSHHRSSSPG
jgi:hypothetical protein